METEKDGAVQSDSIENADVVQEVVEETPKEVTKTPEVDDVQKWEPFKKLISEEREKAKAEAERHFQSVKDKEVAAEKRLRLEAEKTAKLNQAHIEAQRELLLSGLTDPTERVEAERRYNAHVARKQEELNKPSPEMLAEAQDFQEKVLKARAFAAQLEAEGDIETDFKNMKCSDPSIVMTSPDEYIKTAKAKLKALRGGTPKAESKAEEPKEAPKKAPKVTEGGAKSSGKREYTIAEIDNMDVDEYAKQKKDIDLARKEGRIK